jgi:hypothetical protein
LANATGALKLVVTLRRRQPALLAFDNHNSVNGCAVRAREGQPNRYALTVPTCLDHTADELLSSVDRRCKFESRVSGPVNFSGVWHPLDGSGPAAEGTC